MRPKPQRGLPFVAAQTPPDKAGTNIYFGNLMMKLLKKGFAIFLTVIAIVAAFSSPAQGAKKEDKMILIINSYAENGLWSDQMLKPISKALRGRTDTSFERVHLNNILITDSAAFATVCNNLFDRYRENPPSYIVLVGAFSFNLRERIKKEWGDIPMVLITKMMRYAPTKLFFTDETSIYTDTITLPISELRDKYNFTAIYTPDLYQETVDMMVKMRPKMKKVVFLADKIYLNDIVSNGIEEYIRIRYPDLKYSWVVGENGVTSTLHNYLMKKNDEVGLLMSTWFYKKESLNGIPVITNGDISMLGVSRNPVFVLRDAYMNVGGIGGYYVDPEEIGDKIYSAVNMMLDGKEMRDVPFFYPDKEYAIVDYEQLKRYGIAESDCPPGTKFINKPMSFWEHYGMWVIGVLLLLSAMALILWYRWRANNIRVKSLERQGRLISNMPIPYSKAKIIYDNDWNIVNVEYDVNNDAFQKLLKANELHGSPHLLFPNEYISGLTKRMIEENRPVTFDYYFEKTKSYYNFILCLVNTDRVSRSNDHLRYVDIFAIDNTLRIKTEEKLKKLTTQLDMTLGAAHIVPWQWNLTEGTITCEMRRALRKNEMKGEFDPKRRSYVIAEKDYLDHVHPDDRADIEKMRDDFLNGSITYKSMQYRILYDEDGRQCVEWYEINVIMIPERIDNSSKILIGSLLDITQNKKDYEALIVAREKAQESDNMKSAFLANISHEIRTPLNAIVGFSNLLAQTDDSKAKTRYTEIIDINNTLLLHLINDVLDLAKIESNTIEINYEPADINQMIADLKDTINPRVPSGVCLNMVVGLENCVLDTDANRLRQVLINLLTNACKFTKKGSITFGYELLDEELLFYVKDTGIGISKEHLPTVFNRFVKLNHFVQGNGLGLAISKTIIEKLGGEIGVDSRGEGKGARFWFTLPYKPIAIADESENPEFDSDKHRLKDLIPITDKDVTVLVAEDNDSNFALVKAILESRHYRVEWARNGKEAVEKCQSIKPQIILMDLNMPEMDGYEATAEIRKFDENIPIIAVTAYAFASDKEKVMRSGFNGYVTKPIKARDFLNTIHEHLSRFFIFI